MFRRTLSKTNRLLPLALAAGKFGFINSSEGADFIPGIQRAVNGVTVVDTAASGGSQSVQYTGAAIGAQNVRYHAGQKFTAGQGGILTTSVDLRVTSPGAAFGFVGTSVLASNDGIDIYAAIDPATGLPIQASYGSFNNYALRMNFDSRTISAFFNGNAVGFVLLDDFFQPAGNYVSSLEFRPLTPNRVDFAAFGQAFSDGTEENANFDNFRITGTNITVAAPEPGSLALVLPVLGTVGMVLRKRRTR